MPLPLFNYPPASGSSGGGGSAVSSVAGRTGDVTLTSTDLTDSGATGRSLVGAGASGAAWDILTTGVNTIASASTVALGASNKPNVIISGTTTITAFDTIAAGIERFVTFSGALTLTHNATSLVLPGNANIITAANDTAMFQSLGGGNWKCADYQKQTGKPVIGPVAADITDSGTTGRSLIASSTQAAARTVLALTPGTDVQTQDAELQALAGLTSATDQVPYFTGSGTASLATLNTQGRSLIGATGASAAMDILNPAPGTLASASTVNIGASTTPTIIISGTTTITAFDTIAAGAMRTLRFSGALTLTHNATSLILPNANNIVTQANSCAVFISLGSGNWAMVDYTSGGTNLFDLICAPITTLASASGVNIGAAATPSIAITGTTTITSFGNGPSGCVRYVRITGTGLTITTAAANGLPGGIDFVASQRDALVFQCSAANTWTCIAAYRSSGKPNVALVTTDISDLSANTHGLFVASTSLSFNSTNFVTIYTVPAGNNFIWTNCELEITSASAPTGINSGTFSLGYTATSYADWDLTFLPSSGFAAAGDCLARRFSVDGNGRASVAAGTVIKVGCGTPIGSGNITALVKLYGRRTG